MRAAFPDRKTSRDGSSLARTKTNARYRRTWKTSTPIIAARADVCSSSRNDLAVFLHEPPDADREA